MPIQEAPTGVYPWDVERFGPAIREVARNVRIFSANDPLTILGGLVCTEGMTNSNLYMMVEIIIHFDSTYSLQDKCGTTVPRDEQYLEPGNYTIATTSPFKLSQECWLPRQSHPTIETQHVAFRTAVRERDGGCVITRNPAVNGRLGSWEGFKAVHVFPPSFPQQWIDYNFAAVITPPGCDDSINSVQNGIMLDCQMAGLFESYIISINPDDEYKVVSFQPGWARISGRYLSRRFIENPARPPDQLLRWHFRQAVIANMRGNGQPLYESDPPHGWIYGLGSMGFFPDTT